MKCPTCTTPDLLMTERLGIEIDYCPQCRGVWLDRGELDKSLSAVCATRHNRPQPPCHKHSLKFSSPISSLTRNPTTAATATAATTTTSTKTTVAKNRSGKSCLTENRGFDRRDTLASPSRPESPC